MVGACITSPETAHQSAPLFNNYKLGLRLIVLSEIRCPLYIFVSSSNIILNHFMNTPWGCIKNIFPVHKLWLCQGNEYTVPTCIQGVT